MDSDKPFSTGLTYTKSPKVSKRTTFQDELHKAISARADKWKEAELNKYSDSEDDDDDGDDFLKKLLALKKEQKSKEKKNTTFFPLSDDENEKPKKVSFLKSDRKINAAVKCDTDEHDFKKFSSKVESGKSQRDSQLSSAVLKPAIKSKGEDKMASGGKLQPTANPRYRSTPSADARSFSPAADEHPKPMPRQRSLLRSSNEEEDDEASSSRPSSLLSRSLSTTDIGRRSPFSERTYSKNSSPERSRSTSPTAKSSARLERAASSSLAEKLTFSSENRSKESSLTRDEEHLFSCADVKKSPSLMDLMTATGNESPAVLDQRQLLTNCSPDGKKSSTSTEFLLAEGHSSENCMFPTSQNFTQRHHQIINQQIKDASLDSTVTYKNMVEEKNMKNQEMSSRTEKSTEKRPLNNLAETLKKSTTRSPRPNSAHSRYLGTLKILDTKSPHDTASNLETADAIRISIYQDWLQKKKHMLEEQQKVTRLKERTEKEKKMEEEIKKEEAAASFKAWKVTKKKTLKEAQDKKVEEEMKEERSAREKQEKDGIAKMAFEKWKEGKDQHLQNEFKKKKKTEKEQQRKKEEEEMDKKRESTAAFKSWNERKEVVLKEKVKEKRQEKKKQLQIEAEKEEKDRMALELYEHWLVKKEEQEKQEKKQRRLKAIVQDEPPPPWSPPSKTVQYRR